MFVVSWPQAKVGLDVHVVDSVFVVRFALFNHLHDSLSAVQQGCLLEIHLADVCLLSFVCKQELLELDLFAFQDLAEFGLLLLLFILGFFVFQWDLLYLSFVPHRSQLVVRFLANFIKHVVRGELHSNLVIVRNHALEASNRVLVTNALLREAAEHVEHPVIVIELRIVDIGVELHQKSKAESTILALRVWHRLWCYPGLQ